MIHACRHQKLAAVAGMNQNDALVTVEKRLGPKRRLEHGGSSWVFLRGHPGLVRDQLRLNDQAKRFVERLDLVEDRSGRALDEGDEPRRVDADGSAGRRPPIDAAAQYAGAQVELALVRKELPIADVERLVVDEQTDDLSVRDVDDRLARLGVAVAALRVRQRPQLVERVQIGAGQAVRLAFVQVRAQPDMSVGECEHRLRLGEHLEIELRLAHRPGRDDEGGLCDHESSRSSDRSETTTSAPCSRRASLWPVRSTPTTKPKRPARPAATPASASSNTAASAGATPRARAAARNVSGAGFPFRCSRRATIASIRTSKRSSIPAASSTSLQFALD